MESLALLGALYSAADTYGFIQTSSTTGTFSLNVLADRGYYNGDELQSCEQNNIAAYVPNSATSHNKTKGQFDRSEFHYIAKDDEYECPAGERLIYQFTRMESGKEIRRYWSSACPACPIHRQCTSGKNRRVSRWVHEEVIERAGHAWRQNRMPCRSAGRRLSIPMAR